MQSNDNEHTDKGYMAELQEIRERLLVMAGRVEAIIADAMTCLVERDVSDLRGHAPGAHADLLRRVRADEEAAAPLAERAALAHNRAHGHVLEVRPDRRVVVLCEAGGPVASLLRAEQRACERRTKRDDATDSPAKQADD